MGLNILVTGGAGYIGSHTCKALAAAGYSPIVLDDLSTGHRWAVKWGPLLVGNIGKTLALLDALLDAGVDKFVFSCSCATYGIPQVLPIAEHHPQLPINPYGASKLFLENVLQWYERAYGLRYASLRYFNAAGADPDGELGEDHTPETHLIPLVIAAARGIEAAVSVYGTDYATEDGTALRDYVHVTDLARAHVSACRYLLRGER